MQSMRYWVILSQKSGRIVRNVDSLVESSNAFWLVVMKFPYSFVLYALMSLTMTHTARAGTLDEAASQFKRYAIEQIDQSLAGAKALRDSIAAQDLQKAQKAWLDARGGWERSEVITDEFFPDLDDAIDAWPNAKMGFHAIEAKLFGAHQMDVLPLADALIAKLTEFDRQLRAAALTPQGLLNGTTKLVYEIGENKADGGESQFSGNSLADMSYNLVGIKAAYQTVFAPVLKTKDPALAKSAQNSIAQLEDLISVTDLRAVDQMKLRAASEELAITLQSAAPKLGLDKPRLGN